MNQDMACCMNECLKMKGIMETLQSGGTYLLNLVGGCDFPRNLQCKQGT